MKYTLMSKPVEGVAASSFPLNRIGILTAVPACYSSSVQVGEPAIKGVGVLIFLSSETHLSVNPEGFRIRELKDREVLEFSNK